MATTDLSSLTPGDTGVAHGRARLPAVAGKARRIKLPRWAGSVLVRVFAADDTTPAAGRVATTGDDEADIDPAGMPLQSGESYELKVQMPGHACVSGPADGWVHLALGRR